MKPLLVGEANPYGGDPTFALYPSPPGCSGDRLCRLVMGLDPDDYLERFDRVNLCPSAWRVRVARENVSRILLENGEWGGRRRVVLLGAKVTRAFSLAFEPFTHRLVETIGRSTHYVVLPHPSGLSRAWYEPGAFERARAVLREAGALA